MQGLLSISFSVCAVRSGVRCKLFEARGGSQGLQDSLLNASVAAIWTFVEQAQVCCLVVRAQASDARPCGANL
jgi:hypothetical protein